MRTAEAKQTERRDWTDKGLCPECKSRLIVNDYTVAKNWKQPPAVSGHHNLCPNGST